MVSFEVTRALQECVSRRKYKITWYNHIVMTFQQGQPSSAFHRNLSSGIQFSMTSLLWNKAVPWHKGWDYLSVPIRSHTTKALSSRTLHFLFFCCSAITTQFPFSNVSPSPKGEKKDFIKISSYFYLVISAKWTRRKCTGLNNNRCIVFLHRIQDSRKENALLMMSQNEHKGNTANSLNTFIYWSSPVPTPLKWNLGFAQVDKQSKQNKVLVYFHS